VKNVGCGAPLTSLVWGKKYNGIQCCTTTVWLPPFFKISSFMLHIKKFIHVWNTLRVS